MSQTIDLNTAELIGRGRDRDCYRHPQVANQCIKVSRRPQKQTRRERVYQSLLMLWERDTSHIAHYLGPVNTSLGEGGIFELILDDTGQISETLTQAVRNKRMSRGELRIKLDHLLEYLLQNRICVRDISPNNIMCQKAGADYRLMIVDGVSNPGVNPLTIRVPFLAHRSIQQSWVSLEYKLSKLYSELNEKKSELSDSAHLLTA